MTNPLTAPRRTGRAVRRRASDAAEPANGVACRMCGSLRVAAIGDRDGYEFDECENCGLIFIPMVGRDEAEERYRSGEAMRELEAPDEGWAIDLDFLQPALERLPKDRQLEILDFGCGNSTAPDRLRDGGHRVIGVDLEAPSTPHPDRFTGDLLAMGWPPDRFDLVYSFQVFEHLPQPRPVFEELLRLTRPGGLVLVHTDMETPQRQDGFFNWFYLMPPHHCCYYRRRTFEKALDDRSHGIAWSDPWSVVVQVGDPRRAERPAGRKSL